MKSPGTLGGKMLKLKIDADNLPKAFQFTDDDVLELMKKFYFLGDQLIHQKQSISWAIQRVWIDETLSDNAKAYLIFSLGRMYENKIYEERRD